MTLGIVVTARSQEKFFRSQPIYIYYDPDLAHVKSHENSKRTSHNILNTKPTFLLLYIKDEISTVQWGKSVPHLPSACAASSAASEAQLSCPPTGGIFPWKTSSCPYLSRWTTGSFYLNKMRDFVSFYILLGVAINEYLPNW